jgi:hypothetical protein
MKYAGMLASLAEVFGCGSLRGRRPLSKAACSLEVWARPADAGSGSTPPAFAGVAEPPGGRLGHVAPRPVELK